MSTNRIFLTGGTGMVGLNIRKHPACSGYEIIAPSHCELDLMDEVSVTTFLKDVRPDMVIHAAGMVGGIQANMARPVNFMVDNLKMGMNVVLGARAADVERVLNIGTSCMYPRDATNPLKEEDILKGELEPTNEGYAIAKIACARLCDYITRENSAFSYKTIIPCNLYGPYDKFDPVKSHMIPAVIRKTHEACKRGDATIEVWGDGKSKREFMYVGELADFIFYSLDRFDKLPQYLNVGLGYDFTVNEYYRAVADVIGFQGAFVHDLTMPSGMSQKLVDVSKLNAFGWKSNLTVMEGLKKTYDFYLYGEIK
jgi:nucleoside-diphosphate-sugar epimerase